MVGPSGAEDRRRRERAEAVFERLSPYPGDGLRNHCLRIYRFAGLSLRAAGLELDDGLTYLLALLHDLGLVCHRHGGDNYLERTRNLFRHETGDLGLSARELQLGDECLLYNHRALPPRDLSAEAAAFRLAVWIEHSRGVVRFGLSSEEVARWCAGSSFRRAEMKRCGLSLLLLLGLLAPPHRAAAQGFIIPELGARKNGMGTAIGRPDDLTAIYHNPAALALLKGTRVGLSFTMAFLYTDIRVHEWYVGQGANRRPFLPDTADAEGYYEPQGPGAAAPIPFIGASTNLFSDKLTAAIGVYVPNAAGADFGADKPSRYHVIDAYVISAFFTAALAYRPFDWLAIGVGGSAVYVRVQRRSLFYPILTLNGTEFDSSFLLGKETELNLEGEDLKPAFSLGIQVWPLKTLSLGFMMLTRYDVSLEGPLTLTPGADASQLVKKPEFTDNEQVTEIVSPWVFGFGANWDITPWLEVGAELRIYLNSQVEEQVTRITSEGPLKDLIGPGGIVTPKNLKNTFHLGGGFKIRPPLTLDLDLMTGFHYEPSPSPDNTVEVSAPSFDIFALHFGVRYNFAERFALTLVYSHYEYLERATVDSITSPPTNFVGSGYNNQVSVVFEARLAGGIGVEQ